MATSKDTRRNEEIDAPKVRVIDSEGNQAGIMSSREALALAVDAGLDLVELVPHAEPPVVRIMDFGKYRFDQAKKTQASRKKQKQIQVKELKFRPGTDVHDYQVKMRNLVKFIEEGNKVKVTIRFRGREMAHQELGMEVIDRIEADLGDTVVVESRPKMEGRQMSMLLSPKR
ncbi:MAG: translation initiation factor IF-3 [Gammaproteobacteria bacterium]|nr:translation initiation factor IF-3 [Gammaproteobacteria bacterium]